LPSIVGHKTESIYRRYAIVDEAMQREAAARLDAFTSAPPPSGNRTGTVATFTPKAAKIRARVSANGISRVFRRSLDDHGTPQLHEMLRQIW
jgi:hypothetical protein